MNDEHTRKNTFEELYLKERKKANIFMAVAAVLGILFVGALVINFNKNSQTSPMGGSSSVTGHPGGHGSGSGGLGITNINVKDFFNTDGSVNTTKVNAFLGRIPQDHKSQLPGLIGPQIDAAVDKGEISSQQAAELKKAFGI